MYQQSEKLCKRTRIDQDDQLWCLVEEADSCGEVPEGETAGVDIIAQPSLPSPDYETPDLIQDPYLSPRYESPMEIGSIPITTSGSDVEEENLAMGSISFNDILDGSFGLPDVEGTDTLKTVSESDDVDIELQRYLESAKDDDDCTDFITKLCKGEEMSEVTLEEKKYSDEVAMPASKLESDGMKKPQQRDMNSNISSAEKRTSNVIVVKTVGQRMPSRRSNRQQNSRTPSPVESIQSSVLSMSDCAFESVEDKSRKNAIQARLNRQKKKAYISGLEKQVSELSKENKQLATESTKMKKDVKSLQREVDYLRSVLANDSALAGMLSGIGNVQGVRLTTSFEDQRKRSVSEMDHDYGRPAQKRPRRVAPTTASRTSGGVCLHVVENQNVSLEFCSKCSQREP